jgi:hypothetical protein
MHQQEGPNPGSVNKKVPSCNRVLRGRNGQQRPLFKSLCSRLQLHKVCLGHLQDL